MTVSSLRTHSHRSERRESAQNEESHIPTDLRGHVVRRVISVDKDELRIVLARPVVVHAVRVAVQINSQILRVVRCLLLYVEGPGENSLIVNPRRGRVKKSSGL